jgi:hypothetical protein
MPRQIIARVFLVVAVLLAQQLALAHDFWHATAQAQKAPKGDKLCDLHDLLGTVLGAVAGAGAEHQLLPLKDAGFIVAANAGADAGPLSPQSRGPPGIS